MEAGAGTRVHMRMRAHPERSAWGHRGAKGGHAQPKKPKCMKRMSTIRAAQLSPEKGGAAGAEWVSAAWDDAAHRPQVAAFFTSLQVPDNLLAARTPPQSGLVCMPALRAWRVVALPAVPRPLAG